VKKTVSGSSSFDPLNRALMQRLLEALDQIELSRILHGDCGLYVAQWWPLHDERGEPLFPKPIAELDAIKSRTLAGLIIRRDRKDWLPWISRRSFELPSSASHQPPFTIRIADCLDRDDRLALWLFCEP
jgi:hypothetical protein